MAGVFPNLYSEKIVQVGEKIRLDASPTFKANSHTISAVEITPEAGADTFDVYNVDSDLWFLDWSYNTAGTKTVTVEVTYSHGMTTETATKNFEVSVLTEAQDALFSTDADLMVFEHNILRWLPDGYTTWNHVHREAQKQILHWLDEIRIFKSDGTGLTKTDLVDKSQVRKLSAFMALKMIFGQVSNQVDDVFAQKSVYYEGKEKEAKNRGYIAADFNGDGSLSLSEKQELRSTRLVRR
jgi:hypothetical protein